MNFLELSKNRYTTKKYDPTKKISVEKLQELKEILQLSPSSINSQPWNFYFVKDASVKHELSKYSKHNEQKVKDASYIVVFTVIDELEIFEKQLRDHLAEGSNAYYDAHVKPLPEAAIKGWMARQVYLSLGYFLPACASLGIDSTPMEGIDMEKYDEVLNLKGYKTLFAVAIGYRATDDNNQPSITPKSRLEIKDTMFDI